MRSFVERGPPERTTQTKRKRKRKNEGKGRKRAASVRRESVAAAQLPYGSET